MRRAASGFATGGPAVVVRVKLKPSVPQPEIAMTASVDALTAGTAAVPDERCGLLGVLQEDGAICSSTVSTVMWRTICYVVIVNL